MNLRTNIVGLFFFFSHLNQNAYGARILVFSQLMSQSHHSVFRPIIEEMARRGHHIVVVATNPVNYTDPQFANITEIDVRHTISKNLKEKIANNDLVTAMFVVTYDDLWKQIQTTDTRETLFKEKFDLYLFDVSSPLNVVVGEFLNIPSIGLVTFSGSTNIWHVTGNPTHPILYGDTVMINDGNLNLFQRILNLLTYLNFNTKFYMHAIDYQERFVKLSGRDISSIVDPSRNIDLLFVNMYPILAGNRPISSTTIMLGGLHIHQRKPLIPVLKDYLDKSKNGVIYFSLGTFVLSKNLPLEKRKILLELFSELPYNILWKFEDENIENLPDNVYISNFFPQYDIFGHPNVKLFITHGGVHSMEEAIFSGIPMLTMPFHWDQHRNAKLVEKHGIGESMDFNSFTKESLRNKIINIIDNYRYKKNIKKLAQLLNDEPMTSLDKAIWWVEYVLRHRGAKHLRPKVLDLPIYQYFMLDVIAVLITCSAVLFFSFYKLIKLASKIVRRKFIGKLDKHKRP